MKESPVDITNNQHTRDQLDTTLADQRDALEELVLQGLNSGEAIKVDQDYWAKQRQRLLDEFGR